MPALAPPPFDEAQDTDAPLIAPKFDEAADTDQPLIAPKFDDAKDTDAPTFAPERENVPFDPSSQPTVTETPTFIGELKEAVLDPTLRGTVGHLQKAASPIYEALRRPFSGLVGADESQRIEKAVPVGKDSQGNAIYEYKPAGDRMAKEQELLTPYLKVEPFYAKEGDPAGTSVMKAVGNITQGFVGSVLSPLGIMTAVAGGPIPGLGKAAAGAFSADMAAHIPAQINQMLTGKTLQEKIEGGLGAVASIFLVKGGTKHVFEKSMKEVVDQARADLQKLSFQEKIYERDEPHIAVTDPSIIDGLTTTKQIVREKFGELDKEQQSSANKLLDEIDARLQNFTTADVAASEARSAEQRQSTQEAAPPAPEVTTGGPPTEGGTSSLFRQAREEAGLEEPSPEPVGGPGAMGPQEAAELKSENAVTGTKNEQMQSEREARGQDPILKEEPISNQQSIETAQETLKQDPARADVLVQELQDSTRDVRTISTADEAILMAHKVDLMKQRTEQEQIYSDGNRTPEEHAVAAQRLSELEQKMNAVDQATYASGAEWGRMGQLRQRLLREDYSFEAMERRARIQKGEALTPEQSAKIKEQATRIQELETKFDKVTKEASDKQAAAALDESVSALKKQAEASTSPESKFSPRVLALAESIVTRLDTAADAARARIAERRKNLSAGVDPTLVYDIAVIGLSKLARFSLEKAQWMMEMKSEMGNWVEPHLEDAWKETEKLWQSEEKRLSATDKPAVARVRAKNLTDAERQKRTTDAIQTAAKDGAKLGDMRSMVQSLALDLVRKGVTEREALVDQVHAVLKESFPEIERSQARDLISGYGEFKQLDKDAAKVTLRGLKGEMQQIGKIEDMQAKMPPKKTGMERRTPTDEERRLIKEVNELKKKGGFEVSDPAAQLKSALDAVKTRLQNEIRDLDTAIAKHERLPSRKNVLEYDEEAKILKEQRDAKRAEYDRTFPKEPLTDAQKIDRTGKALDRSISTLENDIRTGNLYGNKGRPLTSPEINAKRARLSALREERQLLRELDTDDFTARQQERALQAYKSRTATRIAELQEKTAKRDFSTKAKTDVKLDKEALTLKARIEEVKEKYNEGVVEMKLANRTVPQKIFGRTVETINAARAIQTSIDFSAVLRQGGFITLGNPIRAAKIIPDMVKAFASPLAALKVKEQIRSSPNYDLMQKSGLYLADTKAPNLSQLEEAYMSRWAKKIPLVAGSERAYTTFLNKLRADSFDALANSLGGREGLTLNEAKVISNYINVATGRGKIGFNNNAAAALNTVFFSPRYVASRFQLLAGSPLYQGTGTLRVRAAIAKEYAKFLTGAAVVYALGSAAGATLEGDPRSSDFGKMKFGNTRVDLLGGLAQNTVLLARQAAGQTKTTAGKVIPLNEKEWQKMPFKGDDEADVLGHFARTKLAPVPNLYLDLRTGRNAVGQPVSTREAFQNFVTPMSLKDIYDVMRDQGVPKGTAFMMLNMLGASVQTYEQKKPKK